MSDGFESDPLLTVDYDNDFLAAAAADLDRRLTALAWDPTGDYPDGTIGIYLVGFPQDGTSAVTLNLYDVNPDSPTDPTTVLGLQVAFRTPAGGDPRDVNHLAAQVFSAWHGLHHATFEPFPIRQMWRQSWATPYMDGRRWVRTDNYYVKTRRTFPVATPA